MSRTNGYILLHKRIMDLECWVWNDKPFSRGQAWIYLLLNANFKDETKNIKGQVVTIKRGQVLRAEDTLAKDWGWSRGKVRRFLKSIEKDGMCSINGTSYGTVISIENFEQYQNARPSNDTTDGTSDGTTDGTGEKEVKRSLIKGAFESPAATAVFSFFKEHNYISDPEQFLAYYEDRKWTKKNGQPVTDWKSAAKSWERREKQFVKERAGGTEPRSGKSNVPAQQEPPKYPEFEPEEKKDKVQMTAEQRERMKAALA